MNDCNDDEPFQFEFDYEMYEPSNYELDVIEANESEYIPVSMVDDEEDQIYDKIYTDLFKVQA